MAVEPERHELLDDIKGMIDNNKRSAEIIQTVVGYPEEFWDYIKKMDEKNPEDKCKDLIYSGDEYKALAREQKENWWIKQRRAKIICDFLMFWSKGYEEHGTMINEIINPEKGSLMPDAYAGIQAKINERVLAINDLREGLNEDNVDERAGDISNKMAELAGWVALSFRNAATYTEKVCAAGAGKASDAASATIYTIDRMLGNITKINFNIDLFEASKVGKGFIDSIVGHHTDTVILMLEGLLTVCAGTLVVQNYNVVFSTLLSLLRYLENLLRVGTAGSVLYAIGSITHLLREKLKHITGEKKQELTTISNTLAGISTNIRTTTGEDVTDENVNNLRARLEGVITDVSNALTNIESTAPAEEAMGVEGTAAVERTAASYEENILDEADRVAQREADRALQRRRREEEEEGKNPQAGGKKHKKSQKKPRKKASKSKRSKKAGKKTRKSRKKTRGKKH